MIDHLVGRPSPSWKRTQVFLVILFWIWRIARGNAGPPRIMGLKKVNRELKRFTPWQLIASTLTAVYALRNLDKILGLGSPEPLARLYSPSYYRATWINTGLEAGFATAMSIRPKWLKDICSVLFSGYYIIYANEADEKLRRFRAVPTVEMLRAIWEKTSNPYLRLGLSLPRIALRRKILLPRPKSSEYTRPITAYLFFNASESHLCQQTDLILDYPGGGFVAMSPEHHEERLRMWAVTSGRPVLSIDYGKAPEYQYPFAIDEAFDTYQAIVDTAGTIIGMSGRQLNIIISGDSAGATLAVNVIFKIIEINQLPSTSRANRIPLPVSLVLNYPALDFNFTSWMTPENLRVLRSEQSSGNIPALEELAAQKDHFQHMSPLSMVSDKRSKFASRKRLKRRESWKDSIKVPTGELDVGQARRSHSGSPNTARLIVSNTTKSGIEFDKEGDEGNMTDAGSDNDDVGRPTPNQARVRYAANVESDSQAYPMTRESSQISNTANDGTLDVEEGEGSQVGVDTSTTTAQPIGTRLTMTSRTGFFQDRIISPSMMRAMAILYIGPNRNPDFATDYHISPILAPPHILAQFPPILLQCGEKDPFVDDTVIFAGRIREAKRARRRELDRILSGNGGMDEQQISEMRSERDLLQNEGDDDWVQMVIFSDWSHGYLQMPALMSEAKAVIEDLAEWIIHTFAARSQRKQQAQAPTTSGKALPAIMDYSTTSETDADDGGITFIPKKHRGSSGRDTRRPLLSPEKKGRLSPDYTEVKRESHRRQSSGSATVMDQDTSTSDVTELRRELDQSLPHPHPAHRLPDAVTQKSTPSRQAGTPITETELMRRRRLLDSHMFGSTP